MMTVEQLLNAHGIKLASTAPGQHYTTCRCSPNRRPHNRDKKCLGVKIEADGRVCWHCCHCEWSGPEPGSGGGRELKSYIYRDADGVPRFRKVRNLPGREPRFWLERADGHGGWIKGTQGVDTKIIYRLDEVKKAISDRRHVAVVEGEKDADNLWALGIPATCNAHGASEQGKQPKWKKFHSEQLTGADLIVFNDNDAAGYAHADTACKLSVGIAKSIRRLDLTPHWPDIPTGGDVSDWLAHGHTRAELDALIEAAPDHGEPPPPPPSDPESPPTDNSDIEITRLAKLSQIEYEQQRKGAAKKLNWRVDFLDTVVAAKRKELGLDGGDDDLQGSAMSFEEIEPWPELVDGAELLDDLATTIRKHVVMSDHERDIAALWTVHTYLIKLFKISPKLSIKSATKRCGKSTELEVLAELVFRALVTGSITTAALFRVIDKYHPTLLIDEIDTFVGEDEERRGIINQSHRYDGAVVRTVGDEHEPRKFSVYAAVALSGIGGLADTLADRSVTNNLKRRRPSEPIEQLRIGRMGHLHMIRRRITRWVVDHEESIAQRDPDMGGIYNRDADNWMVLLAIADEAGGKWPERARKAAEAARVEAGDDDASRLELLLGDIRTAFIENGTKVRDLFGSEQIILGGADLVKVLVALEGHPWAEMGKDGKPMTQNRLARMLKPVGVAPGNVGPEDRRVRGYQFGWFQDAFDRYLEPLPESQPTQTPQKGASQLHRCPAPHEIRTSEVSQLHSQDDGCAIAECEKPNNDGALGTCAVAKGGNGQGAPYRPRYERSDDLPYTGPTVPVPNLGADHLDEHGAPVDEPDLSRRRTPLDKLAGWYKDETHRRNSAGTLDTAELDAELRMILREEVDLPEQVEVEFERVMQVVFAG